MKKIADIILEPNFSDNKRSFETFSSCSSSFNSTSASQNSLYDWGNRHKPLPRIDTPSYIKGDIVKVKDRTKSCVFYGKIVGTHTGSRANAQYWIQPNGKGEGERVWAIADVTCNEGSYVVLGKIDC